MSWTAASRAASGTVALLELLATPAPARVVAAHLVLVVDHTLLDGGRRDWLGFGGSVFGVGRRTFRALQRSRGRSGRRQRSRARRAAPARVRDAARACRA